MAPERLTTGARNLFSDLFESITPFIGKDGLLAMKESFREFETDTVPERRRGGFARGALIALPFALAAWALVYALI